MTWWQMALAPILIVLCGVGYRIRGGLLAGTKIQTPGQVSRLIFCAIAALTWFTYTLDWKAALTLIPAFFIGCILPLEHSIDLGYNQTGEDAGDTFWRDFIVLSLRGALGVAFAALAIDAWSPTGPLALASYQHAWPLLLGGLQMGLCYWIARQMRLTVGWLGMSHNDTPPGGEFLFGMVIGGQLILSSLTL